MVKRRKLQWYGHVSRSSGLAKTILQGTVKGGRRQGRQRKKWEDNIMEWMGLEFAKSQRAVENREKWRKLVVKSSVVPQWPSWLWDERWGGNSPSVSLFYIWLSPLFAMFSTEPAAVASRYIAKLHKKISIKNETPDNENDCTWWDAAQ